jgi:hypothetical protein
MSETQNSNVESSKPEIMIESVVEKTEPVSTKTMFYHTPAGIKTIEGFNGWLKLLCIFGFIGGGLYAIYALFSLFLVFAFPPTILLTFLIAGVSAGLIYLSILLWKSSSNVESLKHLDSQVEYNTITLGVLDTFRKVIKYYFIGILGSVILGIIMMIIFIGSAASTFRKDFDKYNSTPLESQKSLKTQQNLKDILNSPDYQVDLNQ